MREKHYKLLDIQKGLVLEGLSNKYLTQVKIEWNKSLNYALFHQSWKLIVKRHETLRAYFIFPQAMPKRFCISLLTSNVRVMHTLVTTYKPRGMTTQFML